MPVRQKAGDKDIAWPPLVNDTTHSSTNSDAGFPPRQRMVELIDYRRQGWSAKEGAHYLTALCRALLPDYRCFGYPLPPLCEAEFLGDESLASEDCGFFSVSLPAPINQTHVCRREVHREVAAKL